MADERCPECSRRRQGASDQEPGTVEIRCCTLRSMNRVHPEYPPRGRLERAIASARLVLAAGASVAMWLDTASPDTDPLLLAYLVTSVVVLALVWTPMRFARTWS